MDTTNNKNSNCATAPVIASCFSEMSIYDALKAEEVKAYGSGNILVKIWFHNDFFHIADFVQAYDCLNEAKKDCEFVKYCKGVTACYIVRIKPKYELIDRVVCFAA